MPHARILTIGHSDHSSAEFLSLLQTNSVEILVDVRSAPFSRAVPQFNRPVLARALASADIKYLYLGDELGGRSKEQSHYGSDGRVRYDLMAQSDQFRSGLRRVLAASSDHRLALMCAEKEPLDCHRTLLVARELERMGAAVEHIHADGGAEPNEMAMVRLLTLHGMQDQSLFDARDDLLDRACQLQAKRVAYVDPARRSGAVVRIA